MQLSVQGIKKSIVSIYSAKGQFNPQKSAVIDSILFYRMNRKSHYDECRNCSCSTEIKIRYAVTIHLFFIGKMWYEYDLMVFDENKKPVYGCRDVPAWVTAYRLIGKWKMLDFYEKP